MNTRSKIFSFVPLFAASLALLGCKRESSDTATSPSATPDARKVITVGFSQIGAESAWRTAETESIRSEAAKRGVNLKFSDAQQKQENQLKAIGTFIAQKVDAIILAPVVETGWEPILKEARAAKIPVILVDRGVKVSDDSLFTTLIASDFVEEGRMAGEWLAKKLGGKGNIVELQGTPGAAPAIDRKKGFEQTIAKSPGLKIVKSQSGDFTRAKGKEVMEAFIKAAQGSGTKIDAVYAHNDDMALGAIQAIEEAGLKPSTDVVVVSIDAVKGAFEAMVAGKLNCTVECNPLLGPAAFDAVEAALAGKPLPKKTIVKDQLFEQSVAKDVIGSRKY
ncbi:MAG: ABC transporter substrate-binding protein [Verrucomicrobia bacterium]|nr:ABC transporter substrate-binding protein [Verrucomicrobiota bacterium]